MQICSRCFSLGYCRTLVSSLVSDAELGNAEFVRDLRSFAHGLNISSYDWREFVSDLYRDYSGWIAGPGGKEVFLDMDVFETDGIREWFREFACTACSPAVTPHVREEVWERVRVLATILRARFPKEAMMWGVRAANDNDEYGAGSNLSPRSRV